MEAGVGVGTTTQEDMASMGTTRLKLSGKKTSSWWSKLEIAVVFCLILVVWGLLSLPIIFYYIPVEDVRLQTL